MDFIKKNINKVSRNGNINIVSNNVLSLGSGGTTLKGNYLPATQDEDGNYIVDLTKVTFTGDLVAEGEVSAYGENASGETGGGSGVDIIDNLLSTRTDAALSANQGKVLKELIDSKVSTVTWDDIQNKPTTFTPATHTHNYVSTVKVGSTSYAVSANTVSLPAYPTVPTSLKNPYALTISLNGASQGAYDGSAAKSINITYSNVGAAASSHTHAKTDITDFPTTWAWGSIIGKPTTLSGYGITDAVTINTEQAINATKKWVSTSSDLCIGHNDSDIPTIRYKIYATAGWARGYGFVNDENETYCTFGAYGQGDILLYQYVGNNYQNPWQKWNGTRSDLSIPLYVNNSIVITDSNFTFANLNNKPALLTEANIEKWNTQTHTHSNKTVLDTITSTKVDNWDDVYTDFNNVFEIDGDTLKVKLNLVGEKEVSAYGESSSGSGGTGASVDIIDNLLSTRTDAALSANQGKVLKELIDSKVSTVTWDDIQNKPSTFTPSTHTHNYVSKINVGSASYTVSSNTVTLPAYPTVPTSLKNPYALTISLNGASQGAYDGSAAKSINITYSNVGAAASSHTHNYVSTIKLGSTSYAVSANTVSLPAYPTIPTTWAWGSITGKPTTLSGYGITDGVNAVTVSGTGNAVTSASVSGHTLTLTKGSTFLLSSAYTASDILTKLKTVDGSGSGLDADTLDGLSWGNFFSRRYYVFDLSTYSISNFYPLFFTPTDIELDCEIHSNNVGGADAYNQNRIHFQLTTEGWSDTGLSFKILSRNNYTDGEITIGAIGRGTQTGGAAIWVRGGRTYRIYSNREPFFKSTNYTYGTEVYSVGTNLYGGTNTNINIIWKNDSTRDNNVVATVNGTVASADKLTSSAGSSVTPVYFSSGKPVSCSYTFGNGSGNAAISNGTLCTNLNADKLDGTDKTGLLTALSSSSATNLAITVGETTKTVADLYATTSEKLSTTNAGSATRPVYFTNGIPVAGTYTFGNASGNAAVNNGTLCSNLNADLLDGYHITNIQTGGWITLIPYVYDTTNGTRWYWHKIATISNNSPTFHKIEIDAKGDSNYTVAARCTLYLSNYNNGTTKSVTVSEAESNSNSGKINVCMDTNGNVYIRAINITWSCYLRYRILYGSYGTIYNNPTKTETKPANTSAEISSGGIKLNSNGSFEYSDNYLQGTSLKATQLNTTRTIWGQSFNGTANVSGDMSGVGSITASGAVSFGSTLSVTGALTASGGVDFSNSQITNVNKIIFAAGDTGRKTVITNSGGFFLYAASGGWAGGLGYYTQDGSTSLGYSAGAYGSGNNLGYYFYGGTYSSPTMCITPSNKYVGIGTTSPTQKLHVAGNILATGEVTAQAASDARLKDIVKTKKTYQQRLLELGNVVNFRYNNIAKERNKNAVDDKQHIGLIYQNAVKSELNNFTFKDKNDGYGSINYLSTDYINLIAGALQESIREIKKLKQEINKIKMQIQK